MYYVYRFLDSECNILYVGKTNNLKNRMYQHKVDGHLPKQVYTKISTIEYLEFNSEIDQYLAEILLINKYKPQYNTDYLNKGTCTINSNIIENWKIYKHKGEYIITLEEKISKIKSEISKYENQLEEINQILKNKDSIKQEFIELESKLIQSKNKFNNVIYQEPHKLKLDKAGWYTSIEYNKLRNSTINIHVEDKKIDKIYVDSNRYTEHEHPVGYYTELDIIQKLSVEWIEVDMY